MAVYGYTRVSTERQAEEGESLGAQQRKIDGYAMMNGMTVDTMFIERGVSGSTKVCARPEGGKLLAMVRPGDVIITPKLDRMFRSALDALDILARLQKASVSLHMIDLGGDVTGNGISKLVFTILSAVAEAERDRIRERVRETKADQRNRGRYLGGKVPFGWLVSAYGELLRDEAQQAAIKRMEVLLTEGNSLRKIAEAMEAEGVKLSHAGVKKILSPATSRASFWPYAGSENREATAEVWRPSPRRSRVRSSGSVDRISVKASHADSENRE